MKDFTNVFSVICTLQYNIYEQYIVNMYDNIIYIEVETKEPDTVSLPGPFWKEGKTKEILKEMVRWI